MYNQQMNQQRGYKPLMKPFEERKGMGYNGSSSNQGYSNTQQQPYVPSQYQNNSYQKQPQLNNNQYSNQNYAYQGHSQQPQYQQQYESPNEIQAAQNSLRLLKSKMQQNQDYNKPPTAERTNNNGSYRKQFNPEIDNQFSQENQFQRAALQNRRSNNQLNENQGYQQQLQMPPRQRTENMSNNGYNNQSQGYAYGQISNNQNLASNNYNLGSNNYKMRQNQQEEPQKSSQIRAQKQPIQQYSNQYNQYQYKEEPQFSANKNNQYDPKPQPIQRVRENSRNNPRNAKPETDHDRKIAVATGIQQKPVKEYEDVEDELVECPEGCGRRFLEDALSKHVNICKKVFQTKRKEFNIAQHRIVDQAQAKSIKEIQQKDKKKQQAPQKATAQSNQKKPKWKAQSDALRAQIKSNRGASLAPDEQKAIDQAADMDFVQCQSCGRKFNEKAAQKHIPFCAQKAKLNQMKKPQMPQQSQVRRK